jgi:hypothetical protein
MLSRPVAFRQRVGEDARMRSIAAPKEITMNRRRTFRDNSPYQPELVHGSRAVCQEHGEPQPCSACQVLEGINAQVAPASDKQQAFILSLLGQKDLSKSDKLAGATPAELEAAIAGIQTSIPTLSKKAASAWIERLLAMPNLPTAARADGPDVPSGHYAIRTDVVRFYKVDRPEKGRWAGFTFLSIQASDELHPVKGEKKHDILAAIAEDPKAASLLYGLELGVCGVCCRTLTDETSRAAGIGPVCREKMGW